MYLHNHENFKDLIEITANEHGINDPYLVEKDYWIMHCLSCLLKTDLKIELKGGTSLSKAFQVIDRFSEDIDIKILPDEKIVGFKVYTEKNHDKPNHRESRKKYFDWLSKYLVDYLDGISSVDREENFDDQKFRNGGIRLNYETKFTPVPGIKEGILLEVGFDNTTPSFKKDISSWAYDKAIQTLGPKIFTDNRALSISCYDLRYTFVEKLQAIITKYEKFKDSKEKEIELPINFLRHYYDIYCLLQLSEVVEFIGTQEYTDYKTKRFRGYDTNVKNCEGFTLSDTKEYKLFEDSYKRSAPLYYKGQVPFKNIMSEISKNLKKL